MQCEFCCSIRKNKNSLAQHRRLCKSNPDHVEHPRGMLGKKGWSNGLSKETNQSLASQSETMKRKFASGEIGLHGMCDPTFTGSEQHRKISARGGGYREGAGRSKKFWVHDSFGTQVCLQSSYERDFSLKLDAHGVRWIRPTYLRYGDRKYFPDFYLVDHDVYVDTKNDYLAIKDEPKIQAVREQNGVDIRVLSRYDIDEYAGESEKRGAQPITVL